MTNKINAASDSLFFDWHYGHQNYMPSKTNYMACTRDYMPSKKGYKPREIILNGL